MKITFSKYQGAGNDFILLDNRNGTFNTLSISTIQALCDRKFGIGADGLIKINNHSDFDFEADYYNADGSKSFCGNGGRCAVAFYKSFGIETNSFHFLGFDGPHHATISETLIELEMAKVETIAQHSTDFELNTGSPHYIHFNTHIHDFDVVSYGKSIRNSSPYKNEGVNVNVVEILGENQLYVRTYERGVEDETLACGTGVTAAAMAYAHVEKKVGNSQIAIKVQGGKLAVRFDFDGKCFSNVWLIGPAQSVFQGTIDV